jgi:outer membrane protein assembly factor BamB
MRRYIAILISCTILLIASCTKPNDQTGNRQTGSILTPFRVTVLDRTVSQASIIWTESLNLGSVDTVKYKVILNNRLVDSNLTRTHDTLRNLSGDTAYAGVVWAYTKNGDTASANFVLDKVQEYIAINAQNQFIVCNLNSGVKMWAYGWNGGINTTGSPTIAGDTVFFCSAYNTGNKLFAYNFKTGKQIWSAFPYPGPSLATSTNPVYHNGRLIVATSTGLVAVNSSTGAIVWSKSMGFSFNVSTPVVANNKIFISSGNTLMAISETNGDVLWNFPIYDISSRPLCVNNLLVFGTNGKNYALDQTSGAIVWEKNFTTPSRTYDTYIVSPMLIDNKIISFVSADGFYCLNPLNGKTIWYEQADWMPTTSMTKGNGKLFYMDYDRLKIVALNASTGALDWEVDSQQYGQLLFAKNRLHNANGYESMNILDPSTGKTLKHIYFRFLGSDTFNYTLRLNDSSYYIQTHSNFQ